MAFSRRARGPNDRKDERGLKADEFVPSSAWTEDSHAHFLLVDLPGFKKEDVKLQVDASGQVTIIGERGANEKIHPFEKTYKVPEGADIKKISGKFEGEFLYVTIPKLVIEEKKNSPIQEKVSETMTNVVEKAEHSKHKLEQRVNEELLQVHGDIKKHKHGHGKEKNEINNANEIIDEKKKELVKKEKNMLKNAMKEFKRNKMGFVLTAVLAFSLGVLVGSNIQSYGHYASALHDSMTD